MVRAKYGDRWIPGDTVGSGAQGQVYRVRDESTGQDGYVLKRLTNSARLGRLQTEVEALRTVKSERIVKVVDASYEDPAFLVMEDAGRALPKALADLGWDFDATVDLFRDVVEAVADAHDAGVIHRDIKPDNVIVDGRRAKLADFGICQFVDGEHLNTLVDEAFGARGFAAPELEPGAPGNAGPAADVYSLGRLAYWMLTGGKSIHREDLRPSVIDAIPAPRGVERTFIGRWLRATVEVNPAARIKARDLQALIERDAVLFRVGYSAVGATRQLCRTCGRGVMERRSVDQLSAHGIKVQAVNIPEHESMRLLVCNVCGDLRIHVLAGTSAIGEWEI